MMQPVMYLQAQPTKALCQRARSFYQSVIGLFQHSSHMVELALGWINCIKAGFDNLFLHF